MTLIMQIISRDSFKGRTMKLSKILTAAAAVTAMLGASSAIAATSAQPAAAKLSVASAQALRIGGIQKRVKNNAISDEALGLGGAGVVAVITAVAVSSNDSQATSP